MSIKKRKTVAFLVSGLMDDFTIRMCNGVMGEMKDDDVDLVVVPVKYIDRDLTGLQDIYEYQYKTNVENILPENTDALLVAADCIGCRTTKDNLMLFMDALPDIPIVLISTRMEGYAGVSFDNKSGVREGLQFLIEKLGAKHIGMLGGPRDFFDAEERREIYMEMLERYDLSFRDSMFVETNLSSDCRPKAELLLDLNPDLDAVLCINDDVAMTFYDVMRDRGLEPGRDIKVFGFDNSRAAAMASPSLSSVDADAVELGRHAYRMVRRVLNGEEVGEEKTPTRFILRDSFGTIDDQTLSTAKRQSVEALVADEELLDRTTLNRQFDQIFYRYREVEEQDGSQLRHAFLNMMEDVLDYVNSHAEDVHRLKEIRDAVEDFFSDGQAIEYTDNDELIPYIERLHGAIATRYGNVEKRARVYHMLASVFKRILKAQSSHTVRYESGMDAMLYSMKTLVKDTLNFTYGNDRSYESIVSTLFNVGIKNAYVYIYEKPVVHLEMEEFIIPDHVRLKAALTDGVVQEIAYTQQVVPLESLFDHAFLKKEKWTMVLMPLYFGDTLYGSVLLDLTEIMFRNGEFLVNQFSTTARVIGILRQNNEIQKQLEENLAIMAENNIVLDRLSKNDVLTGILNRRGFFDAAEEMIRDCRKNKRDVIVSYVDMNNLKIVNDRFGHDDGDFSLKTISAVITETVGGSGTVGRIGGDEFALVYYGPKKEDELRREIDKCFEQVNRSSDKPYNVTVSCGFFRMKPEDDISMEDAMATADQDLYLAKRFKDNRVIKSGE